VRRRIGEDEAFVLGAGGVGLTLDWPGITEPGWVRQDVGFMVCSGGNGRGDAAQALPADLKGTATESPSGDKEPAVERVIGDGLHATLCAPAEEPVPATTYQRLYVWAMAGRYRLRPGAVLEMRRDDDVLVCLPVRDMEEV
jgi:hypothetical protein